MQESFFRTVNGDIPSSEMGFTYSHEHIVIDESFPTSSNPEFLLNDVDRISEELSSFYHKGGQTVVDTMPANCGRNILKLVEVSRKSKVNIIAPTGIHLEMYYPPGHWRYHYSEDQLTDLFIADINKGIDRFDYSGPIIERTDHRAGLIKLATGDDAITKHQELVFSAAVNAQLATGVPILTHTNFGTLGIEQAELFQRLGARMEHVVISHLDRVGDLDYHKKILDFGIRVEYDSAFRFELKGQFNHTLHLLEKLLPEYPGQITLGMDMAKNTYWQSYGGKPGLNYLIDEMPSFLDTKGLSEYYDKIFVHTPRELFSFFSVD